ncbi:MAG: hypothetical protein ACRCST_04385 [Turicibacter sp.]
MQLNSLITQALTKLEVLRLTAEPQIQEEFIVVEDILLEVLDRYTYLESKLNPPVPKILQAF